MMVIESFKIRGAGIGASVQDKGRFGWRRFGVPPSGVLDLQAMECANILIGNSPTAPVIEMLWGGAEIEMLTNAWIAITGAPMIRLPMWRAHYARTGQLIRFAPGDFGMWSYLAIEGGIAGPSLLGSLSAYPRGAIGNVLKSGDVLSRSSNSRFLMPEQVAGRFLAPGAIPDYSKPPAIRVWPAPQWNQFDPAARETFFAHEWEVSTQSDRVGYRLIGPTIPIPASEMISEPVRIGSVQVPPNGQPIITMADGPTVGGYLKLGLVHKDDLRWVAQTRPGGKLKFQLAVDKGP